MIIWQDSLFNFFFIKIDLKEKKYVLKPVLPPSLVKLKRVLFDSFFTLIKQDKNTKRNRLYQISARIDKIDIPEGSNPYPFNLLHKYCY